MLCSEFGVGWFDYPTLTVADQRELIAILVERDKAQKAQSRQGMERVT